MKRNLPIIVAVILVLSAGIFHGRWVNRWGDTVALRYSTEALPSLPKTFGDWVGDDVPPSEEQIRSYVSAELRVAVVRSYTHRETGQRMNILAACGPPGPIGTHVPEACYTGAGYIQGMSPSKREFPATSPTGVTNTFWEADFRVSDNKPNPTGLKIYWSFRPGAAGSHWEASGAPRGEFAAYSALYKIYVIREMSMAGRSPVSDPVGPSFIRELLPALEASVFAAIDRQATTPSSPTEARTMLPISNMTRE